MNSSTLSSVEVINPEELYEEEATYWNQFVDQTERSETDGSDLSDRRSSSRRFTITKTQMQRSYTTKTQK